MAAKFTASVPDALMERMEKWKGSFNWSRLFQDAVTEAITKKEEFQKRMEGEKGDMQAIIERLKKEKEQAEKEWYEQGKTDGLEWAKAASYDELLYAVAEFPIRDSRIDVDYDFLTGDDVLGDWFKESLDIYMEEQKRKPMFADYDLGWREAVSDFWNEVKDKI